MNDYYQKIDVQAVESHRNGIGGEGFHVILFKWEGRDMVAIRFGTGENKGRTAVLDTFLLGQGNIVFGENSWRGDTFEPAVDAAIEAHWAEWEKRYRVAPEHPDLQVNIEPSTPDA